MAENLEPTTATTKPVKSHPTLYKMVLEALKLNKTTKGLTIQGIKRYIVETYPETKENFSNLRLRTAMKKGLENDEIIRPKSSENEGLTGHFLLNRALASQKEQEKKKPKSKTSKESKETKSPKKTTKNLATKSPNKKSVKQTKKTPEKTTLKTKKKTAVKKPKSSVSQTVKTGKTESAGAKTVKKIKKTATKAGTKTSKSKTSK